MTIGKRKGFTVKGAGAAPGNDASKRVGGSLSKGDHFYIQEAYGMTYDPGAGQEPGMEASGGIISDRVEPDGSIYRTHVFSGTGKFTVTEDSAESNPPAWMNIEMLLVGGGGGGGGNVGGGAGAGGVWTNHPDMPAPRRQPAITVSKTGGPTNNGQYPISIGGGGMGQYATQPGDNPLGDGTESIFGSGSPPTNGATGGWGSGGFGGSGASPGNSPYRQGPGSGGAGTGYHSAPSAYTGLAISTDLKQGNPSGVSGFSPYGAAGGGGAGTAGIDGGSPTNPGDGNAGNGGDGVLIGILASPPTVNSGAGYYWGGGGGGSNFSSSARTGGGGKGGGGGAGNTPTGGTVGAGGVDGLWLGQSGTTGPSNPGIGVGRGGAGANCTGGGGGGSCHNNTQDGVFGGNGGSGICILRYKIGSIDSGSAKATGGSVSFYGGKTIHTYFHTGTFTTPGTFNETCEYVVIAGGGGGAGGQGGGGGAGQYLTATTPIGASQSFAITVGAGGNAGDASPASPGPEGNGYKGGPSASVFPAGTITANGGGRGLSWDEPADFASNSGGSGGGGAGPTPRGEGGAASPGPGGNPGGDGSSNRSGGGGGAGSAGGTSSGPGNGAGGTGIELPATFRNPAVAFNYYPNTNYTPAPSAWWVAAGGGGAGSSGESPAAGGAGGAGGGGLGGGPAAGQTGSYGAGYRGERGIQFTGSGGGGGPYTPGGGWNNRKPGGSGGCGIVMIAYPT